MFFILSKILYYLVTPMVWVVACLVPGLTVRSPRWRKRLQLAGLALLLLFSCPLITNEVMLAWEVPPTPMAQVGRYDVAVILTGVTHTSKDPHDRVYFGKGADRVLHPLQLYRAGKVGKILVSGGSGSLSEPEYQEAQELYRVLRLAQVPEQDIVLEDRSRNTHENALYTAQLLQEHPEWQRVLLVTSAYHMRRSAACFRKAGLTFDTFSTDFYSIDRAYYSYDVLIPQEYPLVVWNKLLHEWLGLFMYWLMGYV